ncbi:uncharacterized protein LOC128557370 [Mercenaria mercenaria]|uniref:uncharacterized protein LOC128557370 n=1 Tax=Mercenaria mercenaria TaxID=6596 RepID=UPI00234EBDA2|nr:uncharacterized protein LOC128557370 [Mercenaria mercenaria]
MRQSEYADGGRISDATNDCEPLFSMSLLRNQKMESGYGYFRLINVQRNFQPPVEIATGRAVMYIPGIMNAGARIDMRLKWPQESWSGIIKLIDAVGNVTAYPSWFYI